MAVHAEVVQAELSFVERRDVRWPLPPETRSCGAPEVRLLFERERMSLPPAAEPGSVGLELALRLPALPHSGIHPKYTITTRNWRKNSH